jgi:hypothetical protein
MTTGGAAEQAVQREVGAPRWLILLTVALTLAILVMAVAETTLWTHYLIDMGEWLSLIGLGFICLVGIFLYCSGQLLASLPLTLPWLIYPIVTQGDQIIDNLSINQMRTVTTLILAILFAAPIAVLVLAAQRLLAPRDGVARRRVWTLLFPGLRQIERGQVREGSQLMILALLLLEIWVAYAYLGALMVLTLIGMGLALLVYMSVSDPSAGRVSRRRFGERAALSVFLVGALLSIGLFYGFKNRPGSYQGSPHHFHDPSQQDAFYPMDAIDAPAGDARAPTPSLSDEVRGILADYADALGRLSHAYWVLDRNYNYAFHNALFLRNTPVLTDYRAKALVETDEARALAAGADARLAAIEASLAAGDPLAGFLREVQSYVAFSFRRAAILAEMSARFERTQAGLQHATHIYEGEGKILGVWLVQILDKHATPLADPDTAPIVAEFVGTANRIHEAYANRIVGF